MPACYRSRRRRFHRRSIKGSTEESATHPSHATLCCSETLLSVNAARGGVRVWLRSASVISAMAEVEVRLATVPLRGRRSECARRHPRAPTHRQTNYALAPQALAYEPRQRMCCRFGADFSAGGQSRFGLAWFPAEFASATECEDAFRSNARLVQSWLRQRFASHDRLRPRLTKDMYLLGRGRPNLGKRSDSLQAFSGVRRRR